METLLAQVAEVKAAEGVWELFLKYGPNGGFLALLGLFLWKYGPRLVESHLDFLNTTKKTQLQIADSVATLTETHATEVAGHLATHKALGHLAEGHRRLAADHEAKVHFDRAIDALE